MSISLWAAALDRPLTETEREQLLLMLPPNRREALLRVRDRALWREPLCAYRLLALALEKTLGWRELPIMTCGEQGKPFFPERADVHFSLSHTTGAVLVGLSDLPLGVDVERIRPVTDRVQRRLDRENLSREAYFSRWVRYEASVKRRGEGVVPHHQPWEEQDAREIPLLSGFVSAVSGEGKISTQVCTMDRLLRI